MSVDQAIPDQAPGADSGASVTTDLAARPVTIGGRVLAVVDQVVPRRRPTSSTPFAGAVTPAPAGQSVADRVLRRVLIELVRCGLWLLSVPLMVVVNVALGVVWCGRAIAHQSRRRHRGVSVSRVVSTR